MLAWEENTSQSRVKCRDIMSITAGASPGVVNASCTWGIEGRRQSRSLRFDSEVYVWNSNPGMYQILLGSWRGKRVACEQKRR